MKFLKVISSELITEFSTSVTSLDIREMISPFFSSEKKPRGKFRTLSKMVLRKSLNTEVRMVIILSDAIYIKPVFKKVMAIKKPPNIKRVTPPPLFSIVETT